MRRLTLVCLCAALVAPVRSPAQTMDDAAAADDEGSKTLAMVGGGALGAVAGLGPGLMISGRDGSVVAPLISTTIGAAAGVYLGNESSRRLLWASVGAELGFLGGLVAGFILGEDSSGFPEALVGMAIGAIVGAVVTTDDPEIVLDTMDEMEMRRGLPVGVTISF